MSAPAKLARRVAAGGAILALVALPFAEAGAGWKGKAVVGGATYLGYSALSEVAALAATAVLAAAAADCAARRCAAELVAYLDAHPVIGAPLLNRELKKIAKARPHLADVVEEVRAGVAAARVLDADGRPLSRSLPAPPGDCTPGDQNRLQAEVNSYCKGAATSCRQSDPVPDLEAKLDRNRLCMNARHRVMQKCFRGGDDGHRQALKAAVASVARCEKLLLEH